MAVRAALVPSHDARGALLKAVTVLQYGSLARGRVCVSKALRLYGFTVYAVCRCVPYDDVTCVYVVRCMQKVSV